MVTQEYLVRIQYGNLNSHLEVRASSKIKVNITLGSRVKCAGRRWGEWRKCWLTSFIRPAVGCCLPSAYSVVFTFTPLSDNIISFKVFPQNLILEMLNICQSSI